jgi:hypothetical protein
MPRFRVMLKGTPVFLVGGDSGTAKPHGFYTTRWVEAASAEEARAAAIQLVHEELAESGRENPPDRPIQVTAEEITEVSWFEMVRRGPGRGFTFYPDAPS